MSESLTIQTVAEELDNIGPQIAALLPPDVSPEKFRQVALAAIRQKPDLMRCNRQSLFNACLNAAQDGLLPDGREGAIVPRKNLAVWQPMIGGIYKRVKTSGSVASLSANIVYDGEEFEVLLGDDDRIVHRRDMSRVAKGNEVAAYAIATLKDGTKEREVMTWQQIEDVRKVSAAADSGPWRDWPDEMARKTVVRRLAKRLPVLDPADEALQRTIHRVDALYDFSGKEAAIAPPANVAVSTETQRNAINRAIPIDPTPQKAAAVTMQRTARKTERKPHHPTHEETRDNVIASYEAVKTRKEYLSETDDWRQTLDFFREERPDFYTAIAKAMSDAWERTAPPQEEGVDVDADPFAPGLAVHGEEKLAAG